jgi:hypothetical protein
MKPLMMTRLVSSALKKSTSSLIGYHQDGGARCRFVFVHRLDPHHCTFSLPHWVAYWAAGWHLTLEHYQYKIQHELIPRMLRAAKRVLPTNRAAVDRYLASYNLRSMEWIVNGVSESHDDVSLLEKFQVYVDEEEARLESMLKSFEYEIDAQNSLMLITGPGRIEQVRFRRAHIMSGNSHITSFTVHLAPDLSRPEAALHHDRELLHESS